LKELPARLLGNSQTFFGPARKNCLAREHGGDRKSKGQNDHLNQPSFVAQTQEATGEKLTQQEVADAAGVTQQAVAKASCKAVQQNGDTTNPPPSTLAPFRQVPAAKDKGAQRGADHWKHKKRDHALNESPINPSDCLLGNQLCQVAPLKSAWEADPEHGRKPGAPIGNQNAAKGREETTGSDTSSCSDERDHTGQRGIRRRLQKRAIPPACGVLRGSVGITTRLLGASRKKLLRWSRPVG
jgi:hypothetical protein